MSKEGETPNSKQGEGGEEREGDVKEASERTASPATIIESLVEEETIIRPWKGKLSWRPSVAIGLGNLGNTCYLNSTAQALFHSRPLVAFFSHSWPSIAPQEYHVQDANRYRLTNDFADLIRKVWELGVDNHRLNKFANPGYLVKGVIRAVPAFSENGQQDAQETLVYLLNCLHDELAVEIPPESHPARSMLVFLAHEQEKWNRQSTQSPVSPSFVTLESGGDESKSNNSRRRSRMRKFRLRTRSNSSKSHRTNSLTDQESLHEDTGSEPPGSAISQSLSPSFESDDAEVFDEVTSQSDVQLQENGDMENAQDGKKEEDKKSKGKKNEPPFRQLVAPFLQSIISDCFQMLLVQTVTCKSCLYRSFTLEEYLELSLALPSKSQVRELRRMLEEEALLSGSTVTRERTGSSSSSMFASAWKNLKSMVGLDSPILSLRECLLAFFSPEQLVGEEQYHCEKCNSKQNAEKCHYFAHLPEILTFNLKRFNRSLASWSSLSSSKNSTTVVYPLHDLDLSEFFYNSKRHPCTDQRSATSEPPHEPHVYDLFAVVKHSGGINNGHYIGLCKNPVNNKWYEYDDDLCSMIDEAAVQSGDAYLLFYRKRPTANDEERKQSVIKALVEQQAILEAAKGQEKPVEDILNRFISTYWTLKWDTLVDPGVCGAFDCACPHGMLLPLVRQDAGARLLRVSEEVYQAIENAYGCSAPLKEPSTCPECLRVREELAARRGSERATIAELKDETDNKFFLLHQGWVREWNSFINNSNQKTGRGSWQGTPPPGPISNHLLFEKDGTTPRKNRKRNVDYIAVTQRIWEYFYGIYGGGPALYSPSQELYALQPVPQHAN